MRKEKIGVYWFTNDLRLNDNALLDRAAREVDKLICLFCLPPFSEYLQHFTSESKFGDARQRFLIQTLNGLDESLAEYGQHLVVVDAHPFSALSHLCSEDAITHLYCQDFVSSDEQLVIEHIRAYFPRVKITQLQQSTLFQQSDLPFALEALPSSFTKFRKQVETMVPSQVTSEIFQLPRPAKHTLNTTVLPGLVISSEDLFIGGESFALAHAMCYFSTSFASNYKQTRNELDGKEYSTKFSPWLANGSISVRQVMEMLTQYEKRNGSNESTYWIYFELQWREYFHWYALKFGKKLFRFSGAKGKAPLATFYPQRFKQWKIGATAFPLVNACMKQLNQTGYMSNRGRQLVASCLIHELGIDWRYGAAYFETQLIDYDVASNWGNWQYIAGVGASNMPRRFDQAKQAMLYDPEGKFVRCWKGDSDLGTDSVDMVDWPIRA
ncbi:DASH family cryptochrome [Vibrio ponticus]|uniref:Cryptochrome DASH n=1 Tax=Vibrio ponticus TaxID=265668 RepID=A0A3N3DZZ3_9VIBR|nr:DASH family cryptochrome [Vibrio ponticus]ROV60061.1 DASH family cryptochrome [Vibrio ponticus]